MQAGRSQNISHISTDHSPVMPPGLFPPLGLKLEVGTQKDGAAADPAVRSGPETPHRVLGTQPQGGMGAGPPSEGSGGVRGGTQEGGD